MKKPLSAVVMGGGGGEAEPGVVLPVAAGLTGGQGPAGRQLSRAGPALSHH